MMTNKIRPLHDRVLVKALEAANKTAGGIIIPGNNKEKPSEGEVVAVGNGMIMTDGSTRALEVKKGDKVLFNKWAAAEVKDSKQEFLIMKEDDIIAVINS